MGLISKGVWEIVIVAGAAHCTDDFTPDGKLQLNEAALEAMDTDRSI